MVLHLTDDELSILMDACRPLTPKNRDLFLQAMATELAKYPELGPGPVSRIIGATQQQFFSTSKLKGNSRWSR